ncbi:benzoate/H(+) symporter BenE family transporter [Acinetobacter rathckeae]|uniref:benzoate/H(+) symporter BenE family transporter n=1 Tax=Acinetobacter rathckeae TaxID=2605272 RepID=UPI0018A266B2|nr:benzoate/H(+) symporter BenE family transporter [Acinetobacter rathckeae]MBF7688842.1 benzoate/H(+) symporter BenE family transporter [Acinetobacter rathckeae]MBF7696444.1 benzoate/H(+) symporter BenE family transporter [Acinetobacter rathckeae]
MKQFLDDFSVSAAFAGFITFLVGISVSAVLIIQGAQALGASQEQISSWFLVLGIAMGLTGFILSWRFKYPVATAWSTPGIALIIAVGHHYSLNEATAAFIVCGVLTACIGFSGWFQKCVQQIPMSLSCAMLAGILLKFGLGLFSQLQQHVVFVAILLLAYFISKKYLPRYCIVITVVLAIALCPVLLSFHFPTIQSSLPSPVWVQPYFSWQSIFGLALPLFVVNLSSQFLPGIGMIKSYGYTPHTNQLVGWLGVTQTILAPFGAFSVCLAAISAAINLDEQAHIDPKKRYIAGLFSGLFYLLMAVIAVSLTNILLAFPSVFITTLAGIALLSTITHNIAMAFEQPQEREAACVTFLFSASGIDFLGVGAAFWGLVLGLAVHIFYRFKRS